ncbi:hypothetical protein SAMN05720489_2267 [Fibrobacter sp. UWB13]|nr:hypothetical protein SAMN05720489_2267 [Fibrobacter sp. UWB13]
MKSMCPLLVLALFLTSCAMIIPVTKPDVSKAEYNKMLESNDPKASCYRRGVRGWAIAGDAMFFFPLFVDGLLGNFTYYYYDHQYCDVKQTNKTMLYVE